MSVCCVNCFADHFLREYIDKHGEYGQCDYCECESCKTVKSQSLFDIFHPVLSLYTVVEGTSIIHGESIEASLQKHWKIFNDMPSDKRAYFLKGLYANSKIKPDFLYQDVYLDQAFMPDQQNELNKIWSELSEEIKFKNRFFISTDIQIEQLPVLLGSLEKKYPIDSKFYRARNSHREDKFSPKEMGKPPEGIAKNGRANPYGISYLYLASKKDTAIAEIRPTMLDTVTIGTFKTIDNLIVIDLREISQFQLIGDEDFDELVGMLTWLRQLGNELSKPIHRSDSDLEYLPSQYLCELIKSKGWDGVAYKSSLSEGYNLAIFNDNKLVCTESNQLRINKVYYNSENVI